MPVFLATAFCTVHEHVIRHENNFEILLLRGPVNFGFQMFPMKGILGDPGTVSGCRRKSKWREKILGEEKTFLHLNFFLPA